MMPRLLGCPPWFGWHSIRSDLLLSRVCLLSRGSETYHSTSKIKNANLVPVEIFDLLEFQYSHEMFDIVTLIIFKYLNISNIRAYKYSFLMLTILVKNKLINNPF